MDTIGPFLIGFLLGAISTAVLCMIAGFLHFYGKTIDDELTIYKEQQPKDKQHGRNQKRPKQKARAKNK